MKNIVKFKCSDDDVFVLKTKMKLSGSKSRAEFLRRAVRDSIVKEADKDYQQKMLYLMNKIGNNLNQIARYVNTEKSLDKKALFLLNQLANDTNKIYSLK